MQNKYPVILCDPPWDFEVWNRDTGQGRSAAAHYPVMTLEEICSLPVSGLAEDDSALFLWSVWPRIFDAQEVITRWGFEYKTIAWIWVKAKKSGFGFFTGMGYYTRSNSEPCLLAVRGRMPVLAHDVLSVIYAPVRKHSQKPDEQYAKIERLYDGPYLELFARRKRKKWHAWGNEIKSDITLGE